MSAVTRRRQPGSGVGEWGLAAAIGAGALLLGFMWVAVTLAGQHPGNPLTLPVALAKHQVTWTAACTVALGLLIGMLVALITGVAYLTRSGRGSSGRTQPVDRAARYMGTGRALQPVAARTAQRVARRLGAAQPGLRLAYSVAGGKPIYLNWEQCALLIAGPRTMKTSAVAIPAILNAPGTVIVTTNKRDVIDATRGGREARGTVRVFDPQGVAGERPAWWFNMLRAVHDDTTARALAAVLAAAYHNPTGRGSDPFFEQKGETLLAGFLLALALEARPITDMVEWLTNPADTEAVEILRRQGWRDMADQTSAIIQSVPRQRDGVYGTATNATAFLASPQITAWITPGMLRPELDIQALVAEGTDTLYCASQEGPGNAGPVVAALTVAVMQAAERRATVSPGGRLPVPMVCVLDEAANVCRWPELPKVYSYYGSKGIILLTMLQSWSQGAGVWGEHGMDTMWNAASVRIYGGGSADDAFLGRLSRLIGQYTYQQRSTSYGRGARQTSVSVTSEPILDTADLTALPAGRAVVFATGVRPILARTTPWTANPAMRADVRASILRYDPAGAAHIDTMTGRR